MARTSLERRQEKARRTGCRDRRASHTGCQDPPALSRGSGLRSPLAQHQNPSAVQVRVTGQGVSLCYILRSLSRNLGFVPCAWPWNLPWDLSLTLGHHPVFLASTQ